MDNGAFLAEFAKNLIALSKQAPNTSESMRVRIAATAVIPEISRDVPAKYDPLFDDDVVSEFIRWVAEHVSDY